MTDDELTTYTLFTADGEVAVDDIRATSEEMLAGVEAADAKRPDTAPHYAVGKHADDPERVVAEDTVDEAVVDEAIRRVEENDR